MRRVLDKKTKRRAFLQGMARAFDVFGSQVSRRYRDEIQRRPYESDDRSAVIKDWKAIGNDFNASIAIYLDAHPTLKSKK